MQEIQHGGVMLLVLHKDRTLTYQKLATLQRQNKLQILHEEAKEDEHPLRPGGSDRQRFSLTTQAETVHRVLLSKLNMSPDMLTKQKTELRRVTFILTG